LESGKAGRENCVMPLAYNVWRAKLASCLRSLSDYPYCLALSLALHHIHIHIHFHSHFLSAAGIASGCVIKFPCWKDPKSSFSLRLNGNCFVHAYAKITIKCGKSSFVVFIMPDERGKFFWSPFVEKKDIVTLLLEKYIALGMA